MAKTTPARARLVAEHFTEASRYWKDVYGQDTLNGELYRARRAAVLGFVDGLHLPAGTRALEVGCGAGSTSVALAGKGFEVDAVDAVPEMVRLTTEAASSNGAADRIRARVGDVHRLDFADGSFDLAVVIGVMEWMPSPGAPLAELNRVLRPGGRLVANVDNAWALHCLIDPRMGPAAAAAKRAARRIAERAGLVERVARPSRLSRAAFDRALDDAGFEKLAARTVGFGPVTMLGWRLLTDRTGIRLHHRLQSMADRPVPLIRHGGETYLVLAEKSRQQSGEDVRKR